MTDDPPIKVFIAYARKDKEFCEEFISHLNFLEKIEGLVELWYDKKIEAGKDWNKEILERLGEAEIILLLLSEHFASSDYITATEYAETVGRYRDDSALVIPIILTKHSWQDYSFGNMKLGALQSLPPGGKPVDEWSDRRNAYEAIAGEIKKSIDERWEAKRNPADRIKIESLLKELIYQDGPDSTGVDRDDLKRMIDGEITIYVRMRKDLESSDVRITELEIARIRIENSLLGERPAPMVDTTGRHISAKRYSRLKKQLEKLIREGRKIFVVANCFGVQQESERIRRYLEKLWELDVVGRNEDSEFLCSVRFKEGFVAPLYLLGGPLRKFDEDWPRISKEYSRSLDHCRRDHDEDGLIMQSLLSSNFATWIAWGPSIPVCSCEQWQYQQEGVRTTLQYGFGDENNSLPLLIPDVEEEECFDRIFGEKGYRFHEIIVRKAEVTAKPSLLAERTRNGLARAICLGHGEESELVLSLKQIEDIRVISRPVPARDGKVKKSIGYYTAYVWILFGVTDEDPARYTDTFSPRSKKTEEYWYAWRRLLPFFEHINLADPLAYRLQKRLLVYKALQFINEYYAASGSKPISFVYLCAFDHPNCGVNGVIYDDPPEDESILGILRHTLESNDAYRDIRPRIYFQGEGRDAGHGSACHLSELVERLNEHLRDPHKYSVR